MKFILFVICCFFIGSTIYYKNLSDQYYRMYKSESLKYLHSEPIKYDRINQGKIIKGGY